MQRLCLLATSLLASTCALPAAAQVPATILPPGATPLSLTAQNLAASPTFTTNNLPSTFTLSTPKSTGSFSIVPPAETAPQNSKSLTVLQPPGKFLAQSNAPCYKLRVYGFTPQDLKSPHPRASTGTDCTPAASVQLKAVPATRSSK